MGFFGMGMQQGVLEGLNVGHRIAQDKFNNQRMLEQDKLNREQSLLNQQVKQKELEVLQNEQDARNYERIVQSMLAGQLTEGQAKMMNDISKRMPFADVETLLSPQVDAALGVARTVSSPEDLNDPAKKAAVNYVLTMGRDPEKFQRVDVDPKNPNMMIAQTKDGDTKQISTDQYQKHLNTVDAMRKALRTPQAQEQIKKYYRTMFGGDKATAEKKLKTIFDEKTGRERNVIFDPATGEFTPIGGVKAAKVGVKKLASGGGIDKTKLFKYALDSLKDTDAYLAASPDEQERLIQNRMLAFVGNTGGQRDAGGAQGSGGNGVPEEYANLPSRVIRALRAIDGKANPKSILERTKKLNPDEGKVLEDILVKKGIIAAPEKPNKYISVLKESVLNRERAKEEIKKTSPEHKNLQRYAKENINAVKAYMDDLITWGKKPDYNQAREMYAKIYPFKDQSREAMELTSALEKILKSKDLYTKKSMLSR